MKRSNSKKFNKWPTPEKYRLYIIDFVDGKDGKVNFELHLKVWDGVEMPYGEDFEFPGSKELLYENDQRVISFPILATIVARRKQAFSGWLVGTKSVYTAALHKGDKLPMVQMMGLPKSHRKQKRFDVPYTCKDLHAGRFENGVALLHMQHAHNVGELEPEVIINDVHLVFTKIGNKVGVVPYVLRNPSDDDPDDFSFVRVQPSLIKK
jgi:hypothetical protein